MFDGKKLLKSYFDERTFVSSDIESFNRFVTQDIKDIIAEKGDIEPTIIPDNVDDFKIRINNVRVGKPEIIEADGSKRDLYPSEARLRKLTYAAPVFVTVSAHINGVQRESFECQIASLPIMVMSDFCHLKGLSRDELVGRGEDPDDVFGYFIINGSEKVLVKIEELASNRLLFLENTVGGNKAVVGKLFSERFSYKINHVFERLKDGVFYVSFTKVKQIPVVVLLKALGVTKDTDIARLVYGDDPNFEEFIVNFLGLEEIKDEEDAADFIARKIGMTQARELRVPRVFDVIDRFFLPHIGYGPEFRHEKAVNLCKILYKYNLCLLGLLPLSDQDHVRNKRVKLSGDVLFNLFNNSFNFLTQDMIYTFHRFVKRGKFPSIKVIIREKSVSVKIHSALATGSWPDGRTGVSQRIQRFSFYELLSHTQRIVIPLSSSQENFDAREVHCTSFGRVCPIETPEGPEIGLKKNFALLSSVSVFSDEGSLLSSLEGRGLRKVVFDE